jgi:hypothetical protein
MGRKERKRERERGGEEEAGVDLRKRKENVFFYFRVFFYKEARDVSRAFGLEGMIYSKRNKNKKGALIGGAFASHYEFVSKNRERERRRRLEIIKLLFRVGSFSVIGFSWCRAKCDFPCSLPFLTTLRNVVALCVSMRCSATRLGVGGAPTGRGGRPQLPVLFFLLFLLVVPPPSASL